jgi:hypothetical protein
MFRRAKISVLLPLVAALTASGASLNPERRAPAFQPGSGSASLQRAAVQPSASAVPLRLWRDVTVQRITPTTPAPAKVQLNAASFARPGEAVMAPVAVRSAGGAR